MRPGASSTASTWWLDGWTAGRGRTGSEPRPSPPDLVLLRFSSSRSSPRTAHARLCFSPYRALHSSQRAHARHTPIGARFARLSRPPPHSLRTACLSHLSTQSWPSRSATLQCYFLSSERGPSIARRPRPHRAVLLTLALELHLLRPRYSCALAPSALHPVAQTVAVEPVAPARSGPPTARRTTCCSLALTLLRSLLLSLSHGRVQAKTTQDSISALLISPPRRARRFTSRSALPCRRRSRARRAPLLARRARRHSATRRPQRSRARSRPSRAGRGARAAGGRRGGRAVRGRGGGGRVSVKLGAWMRRVSST